jgi:hypothetical protein
MSRLRLIWPALLTLTLWLVFGVLVLMKSHRGCCGTSQVEQLRFICALFTLVPALWAWHQLARAAPEDRRAYRTAARLQGLIAGGLVAVSLVSLSLPGRRRFDASSNTLGSLYRGAVAYYEAEHLDATGKVIPRQFPASVGPTPDLPPCRGSGHTAAASVDWNHPSWVALSFAIHAEDPGRAYKVELLSAGTGKSAEFTARLTGDLDCDGTYTTFERVGSVDPSGDVKGSSVIQTEGEPREVARPFVPPPPDASVAARAAPGPAEVTGAGWMDDETIEISMKDGSSRCIDDRDGSSITCEVARAAGRASSGGVPDAPDEEEISAPELARVAKSVGKKALDQGSVTRSPTGRFLLVQQETQVQLVEKDGGKVLARFTVEDEESEPQFLGQDDAVMVFSGCVCEGEDARRYDMFPTARPSRRIRIDIGKYTPSHLADLHFEKDFFWGESRDKVSTWPYKTLVRRTFTTTGRYFAETEFRGHTPLHPKRARDEYDAYAESRVLLDLYVASADLIYYVNAIGPEIRLYRDTGTQHEVVWRRPSKGIHSVLLSKRALTGTLVRTDGSIERFTYR